MITVNARGARTLAEARPLTYNGKGVYVTGDGRMSQLHIDGTIAAERPSAELGDVRTAQNWAYEVIEAMEAKAAAVADVRAMAGRKLASAKKLDLVADQVAAKPSKAKPNSQHHPLVKAERYRSAARGERRDAALLAAWSAADEVRYSAYVMDGIGMTDGYYAPMDRPAWKRTLGA